MIVISALARTWRCLPTWKRKSAARNSQSEQTTFLPGALAVQERPPSPAGRGVLWLLLVLFTVGIAWAYYGEVDIVVTASGRLVPSGQVKSVQVPEAGRVVNIAVRDGERVQAGQLLVELDPTFALADDAQLQESLRHKRFELIWRNAFEQWLATGGSEEVPLELPSDTSTEDKSRVLGIFVQHQKEVDARATAYAQDYAANKAKRDAIRAQSEQARSSLAILSQRLEAYKTLVDKNYGSRVQYLELLQQQSELAQSLPVFSANLRELEESAVAIRARGAAEEGEARKYNILQVSKIRNEIEALAQDLRKSSRRRNNLQIFAPVAGTVQELALHTDGGVVTPAQVVMKIVPEHSELVVEALLPNKDIGFVEVGQVAAVKVDTFNFTKFGLIDARIIDIGKDAIHDEVSGWIFKTRLSIAQDSIAVNGKEVMLSSGMSVSAEVKTGQRRLIEFLFSPLLRYKQESLGER